MLASCSSDEFMGQYGGEEQQPAAITKTQSGITFGTLNQNATRGTITGATAAEKLHNNFIVYGFKYQGDEETTNLEQSDGTRPDTIVFDRYNVNFVEGTENTTESNTKGWEYVGLESHINNHNDYYGTAAETPKDQSIKYWDYSKQYVFSGISGTDVTAVKITEVAEGAKKPLSPDVDADILDKGWDVWIPMGGSLADLYASYRLPYDASAATEGRTTAVQLQFQAVCAKLRFAMYEVIPGYSVRIDEMYYSEDSQNPQAAFTGTNFAVDGDFRTLKEDGDTRLTITYSNGKDGYIENSPMVSFLDTEVGCKISYLFGSNISRDVTPEIGTTSAEATYDQSDKIYTEVLPYYNQKCLKMKINYTLTSLDKSGEQIHVKGAEVFVPNVYTNWKPNFAYTYIFKISDNTKGYTNPDKADLVGLYPITFDACVLEAEDGIQETITEFDTNITTYQRGVVVTENDEYVATTAGSRDSIYYTVGDMLTLNGADIVTRVFEVTNYGMIENPVITEERLENYAKNFMVLTQLNKTMNDRGFANIPLKDGTDLIATNGTVGRFLAVQGKTYAIQVKAGTKMLYKVIKVSGEIAEADKIGYTLTVDASDSEINDNTEAIEYTLLASKPEENTPVLGAIPNFSINKGDENVTTKFAIAVSDSGKYTFTATQAAIQEGLNIGNTASPYNVKFLEDGTPVEFNVNLKYAWTDNADASGEIVVIAGNQNTFGMTTGATPVALNGAVISEIQQIEIDSKNVDAIAISEEAGTYTVTAPADRAADMYTAKVAGQTLNVQVNSFAFDKNVVITKGLMTADANSEALVLNLTEGKTKTTGASDVVAASIIGTDDAIATITDDATPGNYTVHADFIKKLFFWSIFRDQ